MEATEEYITIGRELLACEPVPSRTVDCRSAFGKMLIFDLSASFPAVLCKRVALKKAFGELLWMIAGETDAAVLHDPKYGDSKIWDADAAAFSKRLEARWESFPPSESLRALWETPSRVGSPIQQFTTDLGYVYGTQWRSFTGVDTRAWLAGDTTKAVHMMDQLKELVDLLRREPSSRRAMVTSYNPALQLDGSLAALPPCHTQFQVSASRGNMHLKIDQRSADYLLGLPFNVVNYALMAHMLAELLAVPVGNMYHTLGDYHVYENHADTVRDMIEAWDAPRRVRSQMGSDLTLKLQIAPGTREYLWDFKLEDFSVIETSTGTRYEDLGLPLFTGALNA